MGICQLTPVISSGRVDSSPTPGLGPLVVGQEFEFRTGLPSLDIASEIPCHRTAVLPKLVGGPRWTTHASELGEAAWNWGPRNVGHRHRAYK